MLADDEGFAAATAALRAGLVVVVPTDTVYGIAVDPFVSGAMARLFAVKHRPREQSIAVLIAEPGDVARIAAPLAPAAADLARRFWPGPLTLVLPRTPGFDADLGGDPATVGVRCPASDFVRRLAADIGPLATTSANRHREPTPPDAAGVAAALGDDVALVIDGGRCEGSPSTVVSVLDATSPRILREGRIPASELF